MGFYELRLPSKVTARFYASKSLWLPKKISEVGLANYEPLSVAAFLASAEQTKGAVFDIGANIGLYSMLVATGLRRNVIAFEPFPEPANILRNIARTESLPIDVEQVGVSDTAGAANLYISNLSDMSNSLNPAFREHAGVMGILTTTIDIASRRVAPGQIKIDVETMEIAVLRGATDTLRRDSPNLLLEAIDADALKQMESILLPLNYTILKLGNSDFANKFDLRGRDTSGDQRNILAVKGLNEALFVKRTQEWIYFLQKLSESGATIPS